MQRIGVLSDSHVRGASDLAERAARTWGPVDLILHAGDITSPALLEDLREIAPTRAVAGNLDGLAIVAQVPLSDEFFVEECRLALFHGDLGVVRVESRSQRRGHEDDTLRALLLARFPHAHCIIYGHTHTPLCRQIEGVLFFNPGACHERAPAPTVGRLTVRGSDVSGEILPLSPSQ
jgi:putative phosphoesterase